MKLHRMLLASTALLVAVSVSGARADQAAFSAKVKASSGLLGYWPFEGNYKDESGKGNDAAASGDLAKITFCPGVKGGQAVQFDNKTRAVPGQFLSVKAPIGSIFDTPNMSVLVWANIDSTPADDIWDNLIDRSTLWYLETRWHDPGDGNLKIEYVGRIYDPANPGSAGTDRIYAGDVDIYVKPQEWHMYGMTYDGKVAITYLDGKEINRREYDGGVGPTAETPTDPPQGNYDINWGAWEKRDDWTTGCVDDSAIFSRALSAEEVKALYDAMMQ
jgi:hypothetical protein